MKSVRTLPALVGVVLIAVASVASAKMCISRDGEDRATDALIKAVSEAGLQPSLEWLVQTPSPSSPQ
jgi:hypothetical protein